MSGLEDLYREIILDHYRNPRNRGELPSPPAVRSEGFNPLCGDEIVVTFEVDGGCLTDVKVAGQGCSIRVRGRVTELAPFGVLSIGHSELPGRGTVPPAPWFGMGPWRGVNDGDERTVAFRDRDAGGAADGLLLAIVDRESHHP